MSQDNYWQPKADILVRYPRFLKAVDKLREDNKVPKGGIPYEERANWYGSFFTAADEDTGQRYGNMIGHDLLPPNKEVLDALDALAADFNLDARWLHSLFTFVFMGDDKLDPPFHRSASVRPRMNDVRLPKDQLRVTSLSIGIQKDTSIKDIQDIWDEVEKYQAYMDSDVPQRRDKIKSKSVKKYLEIRALEDQGMPQADIAQNYPELGFLSAKDVSDFKRGLEQHFRPAKSGALRNVPSLSWHSQ